MSYVLGRGDDTVGNPHRAQISQFELVLLLKLDKQFPVERFEASRAIRGSSISVSSTLPPLAGPLDAGPAALARPPAPRGAEGDGGPFVNNRI